LEIASYLSQLPDRSTDRRVPLIIGVQYDLSRYGKETVEGSLFESAGQNLDYSFDNGNGGFDGLGSRQVDLDSVRVFGENLEAVLGSFAAGATGADPANAKVTLFDASRPSVLEIEGANFKGSTKAQALRGRDVQVGDLFYIDDGNNVFGRSVTGFIGKTVASSFGQNANKDDGNAGASAYNPSSQGAFASTTTEPSGYSVTVDGSAFDALAKGPTVDGKYGDEFILTVATGGPAGTATVNVTSKSGLFTSAAAVATTDVGAGVFEVSGDPSLAGMSIQIDGADLTSGQVFKVKAYGAYDPAVLTGGSENLLISGAYTGPKDTTYIIRVKEGGDGGVGTEFDGNVVTISDTNSVDTVEEVNLTTDTEFNLGNFGLKAEFNNATVLAQGGLKTGDIYFVHAVAESESTSEFDKVTLSGPAVDVSLTNSTTQGLDVEMRVPYTGEIETDAASDGSAWSADASDITVDAALSLFDSTRDATYQWLPFKDSVGYLFPSFRAAVQPDADEGVINIFSSAETSKVGVVDLDNPLAYGVSTAMDGALQDYSNKTVKAIRVAADTRSAFEAGLAKVANSDNFYTIAPMSERQDVHDAVADNVNTSSSRTRMNFRKAYVGVSSPGEWAAKSGEPATISEIDGAYVRVTFTGNPELTSLSLAAGDKVRIPSLSASYEIDSIVSDNELLLKTGPSSPVSPAVPMDLMKADTAANTAEFLNSRAKSLGTLRVTQVWSDKATNTLDDGITVIPAMYMAAEAAGLRCAVRPHQGITNTELSSVTSAPSMYLRFDEATLNDIAANGTMIITQEIDGGPVFIRHQISTETDKGALYYEDSVISNVDEVSYALKDVFQSYIGKRNVNSRTLLAIRNEIVNTLNTRLDAPRGDVLGPQLINWDDLVVKVDPQVSDRIIVTFRLEVPLPLNNLVIEITVDQSVNIAIAA
jgi:hypothetical protein